jgi:hypothetical protein
MPRSELSTEQRQVLIRRARKLEQLLGEPLGENQIAQLVVDPSTSSMTITTRVSETWPNSPVSGINKLPEFARDDCVPRHHHERVLNPNQQGNVGRSGSLGRKAKAVLGIGEEGKERDEGDLKVYLNRETRIAETSFPRRSSAGGRAPITSRGLRDSPVSPTGTVQSFWIDEEEDDGSKKGKRIQLAKVLFTSPSFVSITLADLPCIVTKNARRAYTPELHNRPQSYTQGRADQSDSQ